MISSNGGTVLPFGTTNIGSWSFVRAMPMKHPISSHQTANLPRFKPFDAYPALAAIRVARSMPTWLSASWFGSSVERYLSGSKVVSLDGDEISGFGDGLDAPL